MSVRVKLFGAMALLVFFMGLAYLASTQGYLRGNLPTLISAAEQSETEKWMNIFQVYYSEHGNSWTGIEQNIKPITPNGSDDGGSTKDLAVALFSPDGKLLFKTASVRSENSVRQGLEEAIKVKGKKVGNAYFYDQGIIQTLQSEQKIYDQMVHLALNVVKGLSLITLLIGFWLSRVLTAPLRRIIEAIEQISKGNLNIALPFVSRDEYGKVAESLNQMAENLSRSEQVRKHLVADVAHELRTPLTILQGKFELIQRSRKAVEPETLLPMQDEVLRLNILVNDLLQLSLAEAGRLPLEKKETDLLEIVNKLIGVFQIEAEEKGIRFLLESSVNNSVLMIDSHRIMQVIYNLIGNAIRYTPSGGIVTIQLSEKINGNRNELIVSIIDTGKGIPPEHLPYVFDRFYRVGNDRSRHSGGMGLGLAIAKQFVEAHGGQIEVASIVGEGTTFKISLLREIESE